MPADAEQMKAQEDQKRYGRLSYRLCFPQIYRSSTCLHIMEFTSEALDHCVTECFLSCDLRSFFLRQLNMGHAATGA